MYPWNENIDLITKSDFSILRGAQYNFPRNLDKHIFSRKYVFFVNSILGILLRYFFNFSTKINVLNKNNEGTCLRVVTIS